MKRKAAGLALVLAMVLALPGCGAMTPEKGYKTQTTATLILGVSSMVEIFILSLILH